MTFCLASQNEVMALQPSEILRVEMEEDPGVLYGDAAMVVNYVVRRYEMGGSLGYNGQQSVKSLFGRHNANGKLNFGKSEVSFYYNAENQIFDEMWSVRNETFLFEDGKAYHRVDCTILSNIPPDAFPELSNLHNPCCTLP